MSPELFLRILAVSAVWLGCGIVVWQARRHLLAGVRLSLDFTLGLYTLTFFIGTSWLFVLQAEGIARYFGGAVAAPDISYPSMLFLASLPYLVIAPFTWFAQQALAAPKLARPRRRVRETALWVGVTLTLVFAAATVGPQAGQLIQNTFIDLGSADNVVELYARRRELFESLSSIQTGVLYGTLPACAAMLLFHGGRHRRLSMALGSALGLFAVVANAGLFQIGPVLAFGLMCVFCFVAVRFERLQLKQLLILGAAGALILASYQSLKITERDDEPNFALQFALRMPVALPYLYQMDLEAPDRTASAEALPFELGEFMFPELSGPGRFISMPQPAFVTAWFQSGPFGTLGIFTLLAVFIAAAGRTLRLGKQPPDGRLAMNALLISPVLYYAFQSPLLTVLMSSYSVAYVAIPIVLVRSLDRLLRVVRWSPLPSTKNHPSSQSST